MLQGPGHDRSIQSPGMLQNALLILLITHFFNQKYLAHTIYMYVSNLLVFISLDCVKFHFFTNVVVLDSPAACVKNKLNRAILYTSMKVGTHILQPW